MWVLRRWFDLKYGGVDLSTCISLGEVYALITIGAENGCKRFEITALDSEESEEENAETSFSKD